MNGEKSIGKGVSFAQRGETEESRRTESELGRPASQDLHWRAKENGVSRRVCLPRSTRRDYMERVWFRRKVLVCIATAGNHGLAGIAMPTMLSVC
jgi:hypothetical protein